MLAGLDLSLGSEYTSARHPFCSNSFALTHTGGPNHIETSPLICRTNHWTGFYMIAISVIKELKCFLWHLIFLFCDIIPTE